LAKLSNFKLFLRLNLNKQAETENTVQISARCFFIQLKSLTVISICNKKEI